MHQLSDGRGRSQFSHFAFRDCKTFAIHLEEYGCMANLCNYWTLSSLPYSCPTPPPSYLATLPPPYLTLLPSPSSASFILIRFNFLCFNTNLECFPFVRTDQPDHSYHNENFSCNQNYPARSEWVKSWIVCIKETVFSKHFLKKPISFSNWLVRSWFSHPVPTSGNRPLLLECFTAGSSQVWFPGALTNTQGTTFALQMARPLCGSDDQVKWQCSHVSNRRYKNIQRILHGGAKVWILFSRGKTIFYERMQRVSKILFLPRENKIHIFKSPCNVLFII